jgi:hypothetical protein
MKCVNKIKCEEAKLENHKNTSLQTLIVSSFWRQEECYFDQAAANTHEGKVIEDHHDYSKHGGGLNED